MRHHIIVHRFVTRSEEASTRIVTRKDFDVGLARKMLREGATLEQIGRAHGMTGAAIHGRLKKLGLGYLVSDRVRVGQARSRGQLKRLAGEA